MFFKTGVSQLDFNVLNIPWKFQVDPIWRSWVNCFQSWKNSQNSSTTWKKRCYWICSYLKFYQRYGHETYTSDRCWQKKMIYDVINIVTSHLYILQARICRFYGPVCKLHAKWRHSFDDVTNHLLLSRPTTGESFMSIPPLEPKKLNVSIFAFLVCKIHKSHVT